MGGLLLVSFIRGFPPRLKFLSTSESDTLDPEPDPVDPIAVKESAFLVLVVPVNVDGFALGLYMIKIDKPIQCVPSNFSWIF